MANLSAAASLEEAFKRYPELKRLFWSGVPALPIKKGEQHPLLALVLSQHKVSNVVALRTNDCCRRISGTHPEWLASKTQSILTDTDLQNVSAMLGEIRALGELIFVWGKQVVAGSSGHDFSIINHGREIRVEVHTLQHRRKRAQIVHAAQTNDNMTLQISEIYPLGYPERPIDNVQGEAVSKIAAIKKAEHQWDKHAINVLWCDLKDPALWQFCFPNSAFQPVSLWREELSSGAFWNAFYAKEGTPVFDSYPVTKYMAKKPYRMEYHGRFWQKSQIDFVIADTAEDQFVLQNPCRRDRIPDWFHRDLFRLFALNLTGSWLDWPVRGTLKARVEGELATLEKYEKTFRP